MVKKCLGPYRKRKKQVQAAQAAAQAALGGKKRKWNNYDYGIKLFLVL